jgi:5-methylcytosine-specific restriction endonuclease McrA
MTSQKLKERIRQRDNYVCQICLKPFDKLTVRIDQNIFDYLLKTTGEKTFNNALIKIGFTK